MYEYPFGNGQQLNLDWFLAEWKNLLAAWEAEKNGIEGALQAEIDRAEAALADVLAARDAAAQSAANALESKNSAAQSASDASGYLATVRADANTASNAAQNAAQSESNAGDSASAAAQSKTAAQNAARAAADSQTAAGNSARAAADSQTAAGNSASAAADSQTAAGNSASAAAQSASDAEDAAASVEASAEQITTNANNITNLKRSITQASTLWGELFNKDYNVNFQGRTGSVKGNKITAIASETNSAWIAYPIHGVTLNAPIRFSAAFDASILTDDDFITIPDTFKDFSIVYKMDNAYSNAGVTNYGATIALYTRQNSQNMLILDGDAKPFSQNNGEIVVCQNVLSTYPIFRDTKKIFILPISNKIVANTNQSFTIILKSSETPTIKGIIANFSETTFKASRRYTINQIIQIGFALYRVTTESIASGSDLIVGTNIEKTTITALLTQLLNN